jgi:hypothetical protein
MEYQDDRTEAQLRTHTVIVYGRDSFLSGWGKARGGASYAGWACTPNNARTVKAWVKARKDIENVQSHRQGLDPILPEELVPETCKHFHVYAVGDGHPALREEVES